MEAWRNLRGRYTGSQDDFWMGVVVANDFYMDKDQLLLKRQKS